MDGADHRPFCSDLIETPQQELPEPSDVFNLTKYRFDNLLAQAIAAAPSSALELGRHCGHARAGRALARSCRMALRVPRLGRRVGEWAAPWRIRLLWPRAGSRQITGDPAAGEMGQICFVADPSVARDFLRVGAQRCARGGQQRLEATAIGGGGVGGRGEGGVSYSPRRASARV